MLPFILTNFNAVFLRILWVKFGWNKSKKNVRTKGKQKSLLGLSAQVSYKRKILSTLTEIWSRYFFHPSSTITKVSIQYTSFSVYEVGQFFLNLAETCKILFHYSNVFNLLRESLKIERNILLYWKIFIWEWIKRDRVYWIK